MMNRHLLVGQLPGHGADGIPHAAGTTLRVDRYSRVRAASASGALHRRGVDEIRGAATADVVDGCRLSLLHLLVEEEHWFLGHLGR